MGWLIALALIIGIGLLPIGIFGGYDRLGAQLYLYLGPIRYYLYPVKDESEQKVSPISKISSRVQTSSGTSGGKLSDFLPLVKTFFAFLGDLFQKVKVKDLNIQVVMGGSDPCDLSVNYGRTCGAVAGLQPHLDRLFTIKKQNVSILCDYTADESVVTARIIMKISLIRLLALIVRYGLRGFKQYQTLKSERKGGAEL